MPHKDEMKGKAKEMAGKTEKAIGRAVDDDRTIASGESREAEGKAQQLLGKAKDKAHEIID